MNFLATVSNSLGNVKFQAQKHSPEILLVTGIVGVVTSTVLACRATLKATEVLEEHNKRLEEIHKAAEVSPDDYAVRNLKRDTSLAYLKTVGNFAMLYGPALIVGAGAIGCFIKQYDILHKREISAMAVAAAADKAFKEYRQRVIDKYGEEEDHKLRYGLHEETIEKTITDDKGKEKKVKEKVLVGDGKPSMYARYITKANDNYQENEEFMLNWINLQAAYCDDILRARPEKFMTLNEAYRMGLGVNGCNDFMVVGWRATKENRNKHRIIEFNTSVVYIPNELGKLEKAYLVEPNVQGLIYDENAPTISIEAAVAAG